MITRGSWCLLSQNIQEEQIDSAYMQKGKEPAKQQEKYNDQTKLEKKDDAKTPRNDDMMPATPVEPTVQSKELKPLEVEIHPKA